MLQSVLYTLGRWVTLVYVRLMLRLDVDWQAAVPQGAKLIVANHPSTTDPLYLGVLFPRPVNLLIIDHLFLIPLVGTYLRWAGHVPVAPGQGRRAFDAAHRLLRAGRSVAIFPEGDISPQQGGFHPPHSGAARLALLTGVPIVPLGIYLPRERNRATTSSIAGQRVTAYWYPRGAYHVTVGQAIHVSGDVEDRAHVATVSERIMQQVATLAQESERRAVRVAPAI
jgi:1-acyl-sn-glycerol-3-phosphate acyltransferase